MNTENTTETTENTNVVDSIDAALAKVKKAGRGRPKTVKEPVSPEVAEALTNEKAAVKAAKLEARAAKKAERDAKRAEKVAAREVARAEKAVARAASRAFTVGQAVRVIGGEFTGLQGLVTKCARKRVFINVQAKRDAYCFVTDVVAL